MDYKDIKIFHPTGIKDTIIDLNHVGIIFLPLNDNSSNDILKFLADFIAKY